LKKLLKNPKLKKKLEALPPEELLKLTRQIELFHYGQDPANFIFSGILRTRDERDPDNPVKPFANKAYLRATLQAVHESKIIFIPKSRQVQCTWLICAYCLWLGMFREHQMIFIQSKKEEDSANLVFNQKWTKGRISFMYHHLPEWLRGIAPAEGAYAKLNFTNGSIIWGIPEGGDIIRQYTASLLFADEAGFQPEFEASYTACKPMAHKIIAVSSANPGYFADIVKAGLGLG
jgi:hypothetical protein